MIMATGWGLGPTDVLVDVEVGAIATTAFLALDES